MCKMFRIICDRKHEHFTHKIDSQLIAHNHETRSRVDNKLVLPRYWKSMCQTAHIFRSIRLWNTTPDDIKNSANLARFKKILKRFILNSSDSPDWKPFKWFNFLISLLPRANFHVVKFEAKFFCSFSFLKQVWYLVNSITHKYVCASKKLLPKSFLVSVTNSA